MKFSDFDKHIQQNAARNLDAPSEFDWGNMDIAVPEQKSRKPLLLLFLTTAILASGSLYFLNIQQRNEDEQLKRQQLKTEAIAIAPNQEDKVEIANSLDENIEISRLGNNEKLDQIEEVVQQAAIEIKEQEVNNNQISFLKAKSERIIQQENSTTNWIKDDHLDLAPETPLVVLEVENKLERFEQINTLAYKKLNIQEQDLPQLPTFADIKPLQSIDKSWTLLTRINHTKNIFQSSNLEYLEVLEGTNTGAWSPSLSIRKAFALTPNTFVSAGLSYHELHTVFSYEQYLGYEDIINLVGEPERIHKTRVVYQNNYSNVAELNLGLGKTYPLTSQVDFQLQAGINGGYQFSDKGKTLNTSLDIVNKDFTSLNRLILSTSADAHIVYKMNQMKLLIGGGFSKLLTSLNTIDNTTLSNRPRMFFMDTGISYQF